jgi:hypothetical protein
MDWLFGLFGGALLKVIGVLLGLSLLAGVYIKGRSDGSDLKELEYAKEKMEWQQSIINKQTAFDDSVREIFKEYLTDVTITKEVTKYIKQKPEIIKEYVSVESDKRCVIPKGFVSLHNKAVDGVPLSELQNIPSDAATPSGKKLSDVSKVVTVNYYEYEQMKKKLIALQKTVTDYQKKQKELGIE